MEAPNARAMAKQLLTLSQDPDNQPFIVQEKGCLSGLVQYTQHPNTDVVLLSTRALQFLSSHPQNKAAMKDFPELVDLITLALERADEHPRITEFVHGTLGNLGVHVPDSESDEDEEREDEDEEKTSGDAENAGDLRNNATNGNSSGGPIGKKGKKGQKGQRKEKKELGAFRTLTLAVTGLGDHDAREEVETLVIKVAGVISVTVNPERGHVFVGTRETGDAIIKSLSQSLASGGHTAKVVVAAGAATGAAADESYENGMASDDELEYLEEDDYDDEGNEAKIARPDQDSSLQGRLDEQKREAANQEKSSRLINNLSASFSAGISWLSGY